MASTLITTFFVELFFICNFVSSQEYLGCYKDNGDRLLDHQKDFSNLTPERCIDYCQQSGYSYAGVEYSSQCFCGDDAPYINSKVQESECSYKCSGNKGKICGGNWVLSLYKILNPREVSSQQYLGCYRDDGNRLLDHQKDFSNMVPQHCIDYCQKSGYSYAGVEYSSQCFCGDELPYINSKVQESECSYKCSGDKGKICGGNWRLSLYKILNPREVSSQQYLGCYKDDGNRLLDHQKDFSNMVPQHCIDYCQETGYSYAGLEWSIQCFCGDEVPYINSKVQESECSYKCSGDKGKICGGNWMLSLYKILNPRKAYDYLGCYKDQLPRSLSGLFKNIDKMTPFPCIDLCKETGYLFAGLQYSSQCFCGNQIPFMKVSDSDCNFKCSGDSSKICGGDWRNSVYFTAACNPQCQNGGICISPNTCKCPEHFNGPYCQNKLCVGNPPTPSNSTKSCNSETCTITCSDKYQFPNGSTTVSVSCSGGSWLPASIPDCQATCNPQCQNEGTCISPNVCSCPENFFGLYCQNKDCVGYPPTPSYSIKSCNSETCTITCSDKYQFPNGSTTVSVSCSGGSWLPASIPDCQATCNPQCQNEGTCISPNVCSCPENFYGLYCQNKYCVGYPPTPIYSIKSCNSETCTITCLDKYQFPDGSRTVNVSCSGGSWLPASIPDCQATCNPQCQNEGTCISPNVCNCPENFYGLYCQNMGCVGYPPTPINSIKTCNSETCTITCSDKYQFPDGSRTVNVSCSGGSWLPASIPDCQATCNPQCQNEGTCISPNVCNCPENFYGLYCQNMGCVGYPPTPTNSIKSCNSETCTIICSDKYQFPDGSRTVYVSCSGGSWLPASTPDCQAICNPQCQNGGTCISPNVCSCADNFYGLYCQNKRCVGYPPTPNNSIQTCNSETCTITCTDKYQFPDGSRTAYVFCSGGSWLLTSIPDCQATCNPQCQNGGICVSPNICYCPDNVYGLYCQNKRCVGYPPTPNNSIQTCTSETCNITCSDKYQFPDGSRAVYVSCSGGSWLPANTPDCQAICNRQCQNGGTCISPNLCSCPKYFYGFYCQNKRCVGYPPTPNNSIKSCNSETCNITCLEKYMFPNGLTTLNVTCIQGEWIPASIPDCKGY